MLFRTFWFVLLAISSAGLATAEIPKPTDAPRPLSPEESAARVKLPDGFRLELVASEPLVREPSGVCWDELGRLFVCELHGYNLEGQYDIEELNKTGELDRVVRRIQANPRAKEEAAKETYGTVKRLIDTDGDGLMDKVEVWADRLPPCLGICPARGGIVVVCSPDIVFLADRDGDGRAEVRETLFTGFATDVLERRMNAPQWSLDNWIYVGRGQGGHITGPRLATPVDLPRTDFRIKPDGSAIEPVTGGTHTIGFAFTETGDRFVVSTRSPGMFVAPLPWRYLARNPNVAVPRLDINTAADNRVYPISRPHPWRTRRADDPGFAKYYTDHYGVEESAPNGYFTSACSPLVYQDVTLPGLRGQLLACEPAQNLVHREVIERDGVMLNLRRPESEQQAEFLASSDSWFHPISLAHAPDGSVNVVDFYREIIEDYSAVPRYLQQQYGLVNGRDYGRIWRLTHRDAPNAPAADMSGLDADALAGEIASPHFWRRQTARRLLIARHATAAVADLRRLVRESDQPATVLGSLYTLDGLSELTPDDARAALEHASAGVRVHGLRLAERWLDRDADLLDTVLAMKNDEAETVLLQLALTLGESYDKRIVPALAHLAREHGEVQWMDSAILSSLAERGGSMLAELLPSGDAEATPNKSAALLQPLCAAIGARRNGGELSQALIAVAGAKNGDAQLECLRGFRTSFKTPATVNISNDAVAALERLAEHDQQDVRALARELIIKMKVEDPEQRRARLARAAGELRDVRLPADVRLAAVQQLDDEDDPAMIRLLFTAFANNTPRVRAAILESAFSRRDRLPAVLDAIQQQSLPASALSAIQRDALLEHPDAALRERAAKLMAAESGINEELLGRYVLALASKRDMAHGEKVFREHCATCHQTHGIGHAVGPDLSAEFRRAEETIVKDILAPRDAIAAGYATYVVETIDGRVVTGVLAVESPGSVTVRQPEGKQETVLRKDIESVKASRASLMPEELVQKLQPQDVADVIAWLRSPPARIVLFDDDPNFAAKLNEGEGTATIVTDDPYRGVAALRITPPQKFSAKIDGWNFRIREKPAEGEFRFLRFAWKSAGAAGVMIELANDGRWPPAGVPRFRYFAGRNTTGWQAVEVASEAPAEWTVVTRDVWKDFGDSTITGIAPTAMNGAALFDAIELLRTIDQ